MYTQPERRTNEIGIIFRFNLSGADKERNFVYKMEKSFITRDAHNVSDEK